MAMPDHQVRYNLGEIRETTPCGGRHDTRRCGSRTSPQVASRTTEKERSMATETTGAADKAVQKAFAGKPTSENGSSSIHLPLEHVDVGGGALSATVAPPSEGDAGLPHETLREMYEYVAL